MDGGGMTKIDRSEPLGLKYENTVILGEWHQSDINPSHRRYTQREACTVAALWAAIGQHEANCYNAGAVSDGNDEAEVGAMHASRDMLRELLGLEAE